MKQLKFPDCSFSRKLQNLLAEGEKVNCLIEKILDLSDWGFELTQEYGEKMTI